MAIKNDYQAGNISVANGGMEVTGAGGTLWLAAKILPGATLKVQNLDAIISSVNSNSSITLKEPWTGTSLVASPYAIRFQPDGSSLAAATRDLLEKLGNGNVEALADLNLDYNKIPIGTGPGAFTLIDRSELTQGVDVDAKVATMAERALYDGQAKGFTVMVAHAADPNVLANPGFELGATGWTLTTGITIDSTVSHSGANCAKLDKGSVGAGGTARNLVTASKYAVSPGETYLVSGWVRCNSGQSSAGGAYLTIYWYDATDTLISAVNAVSNQPFTPTWTKLSGSAVAPANAATATVRAINNTPSTAQNLFVDDVQFQLRDGSRSAVYFKQSAAAGDWSEASYLTGPPGGLSEISVGATSTLAPGAPATVVNAGTPEVPVLNFGIPRGRGVYPRGAYSAATAYTTDDIVTYDSSTWIALQSTTGNSPPALPAQANAYWHLVAAKGTTAFVRGYVYGLKTSNNAADPLHDIDIAVGQARDVDDQVNINLTTAITKRLDAVWAAGSGNGGLDTGTAAADTFYHVLLIWNNTTQVADALFTTSPFAPTLPTGFNNWVRIGAIYTDSSANIRAYIQRDDEFTYEEGRTEYAAGTAHANNTTVLRQLLAANMGLKVEAIIMVILINTTAQATLALKDSDMSSDLTHPSHSVMIGTTAAGGNVARLYQWVDATGHFNMRVSAGSGSTTFRLNTVGFRYPRGRLF